MTDRLTDETQPQMAYYNESDFRSIQELLMPTHVIPDEEHACRLLMDHFAIRGQSGFSCERSSFDPPDLLVRWDDGRQWGVEVTRTYLQVPASAPTDDSPQRRKMLSSQLTASAEFTEPLQKFGEALGQEPKCIRKRDYTLCLGPSSADSLGMSARPNAFGRQWKKAARKAILEHLRNAKPETLRHPGVWLKPGSPGDRWTVAVHPGVQEIREATCTMLEQTMTRKGGALPRWTGNFAQRWLLLLNHYPLVSDVREVETTIRRLLRNSRDCCGFDGIFWNAGLHYSLVAVASIHAR